MDKEAKAEGKIKRLTALFGRRGKSSRPFSLTVFTDGKRGEISRYKKFCHQVKRIKDSDDSAVPVTRFNPDVKTGLNNEQIKSRVNEGLVNYTHRGSTKTIKRILFTNLMTWFNLVSFTALGLLIWIAQTDPKYYISCYFIVIIVINILIGVIQELRAKFTIEKMSLVTASKTKVVRNGEKLDLIIDDVVLDDILVLTTGQQIPADSVVVDGMIEVNESLLTGESVPVQKGKGATVLAGSFVVSGTCYVRVEKISSDSYVQTLAKGATRYVRPRSELLASLRIIIRTISFIMVILMTGLIASQAALTDNFVGDSKYHTVATAVGACVGMIPAGMFLLTSLALAVGVINLSKHHTLVQELYCIEMLARVDTLCLDKTGTITNGTMKVADIVEIKNTSNYTLREIIASMCFALEDNNQTSIALQDHFGNQMILKSTATLPFSSSRKLSAVSFEDEGTFVLGAPEFVLKERNDRVEDRVKRFASQGYRVLLLGRAIGQLRNGELPGEVRPVAIITLQDQIRADAPATIDWFKKNGVNIRVISGDNPITVSEVARRAGVAGAEKFVSLEGMSPIEVRNIANDYTIFGRVSPEQKLILVKEFKNHGHTVAMTGDGVNDILALREADCSVAMAAGSEAARNVSHLVLLDNDFSSMPKVVAQGRRVINNIQRTSSIFLFKTISVMLLVAFCIATAQPYFFETQHMLMLEVFVIGIPSFILALEINDAQIKGKFLLNVLRNSFAGAIVVLLNVVVLYAFKESQYFFDSVTAGQFKTLIIFSTTITGLFMLWKIIMPPTIYRMTLMILMSIFVSLFAYFGSGILELETLGTMNVLLLIIMMQASYPLIAFVNKMLSQIRLDRIPVLGKIGKELDR